MDYTPYSGGPDIFADSTPLLVTDLVRNVQYQVQIVDFYIDDQMNGIVFFDGVEYFRQSNIDSYEVLERLFYMQFLVQ
jgi:hypothetical protein